MKYPIKPTKISPRKECFLGVLAIAVMWILLFTFCMPANVDAAMHTALITRVVDGDTVVCDIKVGFNIVLANQRIRLEDIDAPEMRGDNKEAGKASKAWLKEQVEGKFITFDTSYKHDSFGRWIGYIMLDDININKELVRTGHAVAKRYK